MLGPNVKSANRHAELSKFKLSVVDAKWMMLFHLMPGLLVPDLRCRFVTDSVVSHPENILVCCREIRFLCAPVQCSLSGHCTRLGNPRKHSQFSRHISFSSDLMKF